MPGSSTGAAGSNRVEEASDTCNVVIFGEAGAGKSSLVNLIVGTDAAPTSCDTLGCTTGTDLYMHDIRIRNKTLKLNLFDTAGLGEGSEGTVPDEVAQRGLEKLLRKLTKKDGIHLLMYCVHGTKGIKALCRNYEICNSEVEERVQIVLVVTGLEDKQPEMEQWWKDNEQTISHLGMTFAGHACITALNIEDASGRHKQRHDQSYHAVRKLIEECRATRQKPKNIVIFGETGAGKSSLVNLMAGKEVAVTSPDTRRCTLHWKDYTIGFGGKSYKVFDTMGIEDLQLGMAQFLESVGNAYKLIAELDRQGGIDLLLFCFRAGKYNLTVQRNYRLFHEFLCDKKIPIVLVVTNLEREERMEDWWDRNHDNFERYGIQVTGHACITAANGLDGRHRTHYKESRITIRNIVRESITDEHILAWIGGKSLFVSLIRKLMSLLAGHLRVRSAHLVVCLVERCGISREVAKELADTIQK
ncbi:P-loop containing nucleoside triphosphate hydrolase protein [Suillus paluster]|uniref:P-loop containing nucleoside triphosphate hydrolase protein n=1 Tax=Suillus paluster TaxID=48578 RepID=UPI001B878BA5|nr:P-loop containing nucleoside triphosphate hydrolase protein [Suillus paluster]KAG1741504.1 P-loop containing nucleoside triphosphate hydrolase protein [Suillus paluster]